MSVSFRVEGPWTGWTSYNIVPVEHVDDLIPTMSNLNEKNTDNFEKSCSCEIYKTDARISENVIYTSVYIDKKKCVELYFNGNYKIGVPIPNVGRYHSHSLIPDFKVIAICVDIDNMVLYHLYSFQGAYLGSINNNVYFYQIKK